MNHDYSEAVISAVWEKGRIVPGIDPARRRKDACGAWIDRDQYGVTEENGAGWQVDGIPVDLRDGSEVTILQPTQWENFRAKVEWADDVANGRIDPRGWFCVREARIANY